MCNTWAEEILNENIENRIISKVIELNRSSCKLFECSKVNSYTEEFAYKSFLDLFSYNAEFGVIENCIYSIAKYILFTIKGRYESMKSFGINISYLKFNKNGIDLSVSYNLHTRVFKKFTKK